MATKRSFSEKVTGGDAFAELSFEAQALYLQLSMAADDDGFVSAPKKVQKSIGASISALDELEGRGYLVFFDSGACVIAHWNQNNYINQKRKKATEHAEEFSRLYLDEDGVYHEIEDIEESAASEKYINSDDNSLAECSSSKLPANYRQITGKLPAKTLPPSFLPLCSPSLPSPCTPIYYTPYNPPQITPTPLSSSSPLYRARAQEFAVRYWGRKLRKYEKSEIFELSEGLVRLRGPDADLADSDIELLEIAFKASAEAASPSVAYIRGVYDNWEKKGVLSLDDYWENEVQRDRIFQAPLKAHNGA